MSTHFTSCFFCIFYSLHAVLSVEPKRSMIYHASPCFQQVALVQSVLLLCSGDGAGVSFLIRCCLIVPIFIVSERARVLKISTSGVPLLPPGGGDVTPVRSADSCSFCITSSKLQKEYQGNEGNWQSITKLWIPFFLFWAAREMLSAPYGRPLVAVYCEETANQMLNVKCYIHLTTK